MKYEGHELKEIDTSVTQVFDPPKEMLVWDSDDGHDMHKATVCAIISSRQPWYKVVAGVGSYEHCAEIPKSKPVTKRELARWLAEGNGEMRRSRDECMVYTGWLYDNSEANKFIDESIIVRKWDDEDWHAPTREYLGLEGK